MSVERQQLIHQLFGDCINMYSLRDDRFCTMFSENFSGCVEGCDLPVRDAREWALRAWQDVATMSGHIACEVQSVSSQDVSESVFVVTALIGLHSAGSPAVDRSVRNVLVWLCEDGDWKIVHGSTSVVCPRASGQQVAPARNLYERNRVLEELIEEQTEALADANRRLEAMNTIDALTGIANRRCFDRTFVQEWDRGLRGETPVALIRLDVDQYRHYADTYGTHMGEACLHEIGCVLAQATRRAGDLAARYEAGGFVVILPNANEHDAMRSARNIQQAVCAMALPHKGTAAGILTLSIGVASTVPAKAGAGEELLQHADAALQHARAAGSNGLQLAKA